MDINSARELLTDMPAAGFDAYERETGDCQLVVPILHEDDDMVDIFLADSPLGEGYVRLCDYGMALMRLSYTFDISTSTREDIFESILINNGVTNDGGNLYLDAPVNRFYESVLQFAGCIQKVCNMRYWTRETVRSAFYDDLGDYIRADLTHFSPVPNVTPIREYSLVSVDWGLTWDSRNLYLFGVRGNGKASSVALCLSELKKAQLPFIGFVVHDSMENLGRREQFYLTRNADKQYPDFDAFKGDIVQDIYRITDTQLTSLEA